VPPEKPEKNSSGGEEHGLSPDEQEEAGRITALPVDVVHRAILNEGEHELSRPVSALAWSGLAAGLSMTFSLIGEGLLRAALPDEPWRPLLAKFGYTLGFLIVVLGRQQLFTENTLTVIIPLLHHKNGETFGKMLRLWAVVLAANLVGTFCVAWVLSRSQAVPGGVQTAFSAIGHEALRGDFWAVTIRGIFAGWLIATMVWLLPAAETAHVPVIVIITYFVGLGGFAHIVAGSAEVFYLVCAGEIGWAEAAGNLVPTLLGNIIGGVTLVAMVNHAQVVSGKGEGA
jgi:formate/nitrite transporter FocA (FNT family)